MRELKDWQSSLISPTANLSYETDVTKKMKKSDINPMLEYFDRYINLVADVELAQAFDDSIRRLDDLDKNTLGEINR